MFAICRLVAWCLILLVAPGPAAAQTIPRPYPGDRLAYISGGKLYVGFPQAHLVPGPGNAFQPAFSYDGQWLAFLRQVSSGGSQLWVARADGSRPRYMAPFVASFAWSPAADVIAARASTNTASPNVILMTPIGKPRPAPGGLGGSFAWSPDGHTLAVAGTALRYPSRLSLIRGNSVQSVRLPYREPHSPVLLPGWWPGNRGILYWTDPTGCHSCIADGTHLFDYDLTAGTVRSVGFTLPYRDWVAPHGNQLLTVQGGARSAFFGKHLQLCVAGGRCRWLPGSAAPQISDDPAWSPVSEELAFVVAPAWNTEGWDNRAHFRRWLNAHVLWTGGPMASGSLAWEPSRSVPAGVSAPQWTRDGRGLLFVRNGALWLDVHYGASNPRRLAQLIPPNTFPDQSFAYQLWYYGHMNWHDLFAWY